MPTFHSIVIVLITILLNSFTLFSQEKLLPAPSEAEMDSLELIYGAKKEYPEMYRAPILIALSRFPELKETPIEFRYANISTSLNAKPTFVSLFFRKKEFREYIIRINNNDADSLITLNEVSFNAQVGVFAHELSHILSYEGKTFGKMVSFGLDYIKNTRKELIEKETDRTVIARGFGWQLYDWAHYVLSESDASSKYKQFKRDIYLEPFEIIQYINTQDSSSVLPMTETIECSYIQWGCLCPNWITVEDKAHCDSTENKLIDYCIYVENANGHLINLQDFHPERQNIILTGNFVEDQLLPKDLKGEEETVRPAPIFRYTKFEFIDTM